MYTLVSGLYQQWTQKEEYFVIIIGLDNAGKTTLLERIKTIFMGVAGLRPDQIGPTVGLNVGKADVKNSRLILWDLGGQRELQSIWEKYYSECHGIIFVVDSTDRARIDEVKETLGRVIQNEIVEGVPVLMLANKQDSNDALTISEIQQIFNQIAVKLEARDSKVLGVSALQGTGVKDAMEWMQLRLVRNREQRPPVVR
eukprot:jgi/Hompol1/7022/HPOL_000287-RA